jgi:hypothetical protein
MVEVGVDAISRLVVNKHLEGQRAVVVDREKGCLDKGRERDRHVVEIEPLDLGGATINIMAEEHGALGVVVVLVKKGCKVEQERIILGNTHVLFRTEGVDGLSNAGEEGLLVRGGDKLGYFP